MLRRRAQQLAWLSVLIVLVISLALLSLPDYLTFDRFAFGDAGGVLHVEQMIRSGLRPKVDFIYAYGPLPLLVGHAWFTLLGNTPVSLVWLTSLANLALVGALFWTIFQKHTSLMALLVFCALPIYPSYHPPSLTHVLEPTFLTIAIGAHLRGRYAAALASATLAYLCKPALGAVYGAPLMICLVFDSLRLHGGWRLIARRLIPALVTIVVVIAIASAWVGFGSAVRMLLPDAGARFYTAGGQGLFTGVGRAFIAPHGATWRYYVGSVAGIWIVLSVLVLAVGCAAGFRTFRLRRSADHPNDSPLVNEVLFSCAGAHLGFGLLFFGNPWIWQYYFVLLLIPTLLLVRQIENLRLRTVAASALGAAFLLASYSWATGLRSAWIERSRADATYGLYASRPEAEFWASIRNRVRERPTTVVASSGAASVLDPRLQQPDYWFLLPGWDTPDVLAGIRRQVEHADFLIYANVVETAVRARMDLSSLFVGFEREAASGRVELWSRSYRSSSP